MSEAIEARLKSMGVVLPATPTPVANYVPFVVTGALVFLSGQGPRRPEGGMYTGKVGGAVSVDEAYGHARIVGIQLLSALKEAIGDLDRVTRIVKLLGMVNGTPDFKQQPKVINGCSDFLVEVFEAKGRHARSAVGMGSLPDDITVEIEAVIEFK